MLYLHSNFVLLLSIYLISLAKITLQMQDEAHSVKKDFKIISTAEAALPISNKTHQNQTTINSDNIKIQEDNSIVNMKSRVFQKNLDIEIPESFKMGFYFFIGLSIVGILFILVKIYRMRLSRAERKYGVHGDRTTQELTPLPMAIEDDSDNEDHTLFDINRQVRVS